MQLLENWDPLSLPRGSIRALMTIVLLGTLWALMLLGREIPMALPYVTLVILGEYFGFRGGESPPSGGKHPLFLPRGSIRILIVLGFATVAYFLWRDGRIQFNARDRNFAILCLMAALMAGFLVRKVLDLLTRGPIAQPRKWFENVKAVTALAASALLVICCVLEAESSVRENAALLAAPIVVFYFGSRK